MNKSQFVFKMVDIVLEKSQNPFNYDSVYCVKDIPYSDRDEKQTCGDLYFNPLILKDGKKHPVILNIHGGGFIMGDKRYRKTLCEYYASKGYYVYNINFRMPPQVDVMGSIHDVVDAANFINQLAEAYSIDLNKIIVTGDSSGAYLAAYIESIRTNPEIAEATKLPEVKIDVAGAILHSGPYDMNAMIDDGLPMGLTPELASMLVGYELKEDMSDIVDYKYFNYMSPSDFVNDKWCPCFISWSDSDFVVPNQGRPMAEKLMKNCPRVSTFYAEGITNGHCFHLTMKKDIAMECIDKSIDFIEQIFDEIDSEVKIS